MPTTKAVRRAILITACNIKRIYPLTYNGALHSAALEVYNGITDERRSSPLKSPRIPFYIVLDVFFDYIEGKPNVIKPYGWEWLEEWADVVPREITERPTLHEAKDMIRAARSYRQELKELTERTAGDRQRYLLSSVMSKAVSARIVEHLRYFNEVDLCDERWICSLIYHMGYVDGRRAALNITEADDPLPLSGAARRRQ